DPCDRAPPPLLGVTNPVPPGPNTMTTLKDRITDDMKTAMRGGERERLGTIRRLQAAIKQREVDERIVLDDAQVLGVIEKMIKQRRDSIAQFRAAAREGLATKEEY